MKFCIYQCKHYGDALLTTPLISSLVKTFPEAELIVVCSSYTVPIFSGLKGVSAVIKKPSSLSEWWRMLHLIVQSQVIFMPHSSGIPLVIGKLLGIPTVADAGYRIKVFGGAQIPVPTSLIPWRHAAEKNLDLLRKYAGPQALVDKHILCSELVKKGVNPLGKIDRPYVVCHPGTRWMYKTPPFDFWCALLEGLVRLNYLVVLTGVDEGAEGALLVKLGSRLRESVSLAGRTDINSLARVISDATGYVGVDTFASHLAAGVGTPGVAIYGPTSELRWGPFGLSNNLDVYVQDGFSCRPCHVDGCGGGKVSDCLLNIEHDQVLASLLRRMGN